MLMAHPTVLRNLLDHYEALRALAKEQVVGPQIHRQMQDAAYTLCVSTGTQDVDRALEVARRSLDDELAVIAS